MRGSSCMNDIGQPKRVLFKTYFLKIRPFLYSMICILFFSMFLAVLVLQVLQKTANAHRQILTQKTPIQQTDIVFLEEGPHLRLNNLHTAVAVDQRDVISEAIGSEHGRASRHRPVVVGIDSNDRAVCSVRQGGAFLQIKVQRIREASEFIH